MSAALGIQHKKRMRNIVICGLHGYTILFPHYLINRTILGKSLLNIERVFSYLLDSASLI